MSTEEKVMELEKEVEKLKYALSDKEIDIAELRGVIRGLKYGLRCNGISGAEDVEKCSEKPNGSGKDTIYRQDAIDAVKRNTFRLMFSEEQNYEGHVAWSAEAVYSDVMEGALLELPSAQPDFDTDQKINKAYDDGYNQGYLQCKMDQEEKEVNKVEKANATFGTRISDLLDQQGLSQRELADKVGVTEVSMSRYIKGERTPKGPIIANIAKVLHTTSDFLLGLETEETDIDDAAGEYPCYCKITNGKMAEKYPWELRTEVEGEQNE